MSTATGFKVHSQAPSSPPKLPGASSGQWRHRRAKGSWESRGVFSGFDSSSCAWGGWFSVFLGRTFVRQLFPRFPRGRLWSNYISRCLCSPPEQQLPSSVGKARWLFLLLCFLCGKRLPGWLGRRLPSPKITARCRAPRRASPTEGQCSGARGRRTSSAAGCCVEKKKKRPTQRPKGRPSMSFLFFFFLFFIFFFSGPCGVRFVSCRPASALVRRSVKRVMINAFSKRTAESGSRWKARRTYCHARVPSSSRNSTRRSINPRAY